MRIERALLSKQSNAVVGETAAADEIGTEDCVITSGHIISLSNGVRSLVRSLTRPKVI